MLIEKNKQLENFIQDLEQRIAARDAEVKELNDQTSEQKEALKQLRTQVKIS